MPKQKQIYATFVLGFIVAFVELFGLPGLGLTHSQEITAAILLIAAFLWVLELVSLFIVSFLILALELVWLLPALNHDGIATDAGSFYSAFFSNIILLFLGGFVLSALMQKYGLDLTFAQFILRKTKGKPKITLLGIIVACAFLSMWISNTATTAMMLTIVFPLLKHIPENHGFKVALVLSIPFACNIGGIGTPIGTPPNAIALSYLVDKGINMSFLQWMLLTLPFLLIFLVILWLLLWRMYPASELTLEIKERTTSKFSLKHWSTLSIFFLTGLGWLFGNSLGLSTGTVALLPVIASFWFGLLDNSDFRKLPWDILYIISGGLALGIALTISGLGAVFVSQLPVEASPLYLIIVGAGVAGLMSTVMSNTATAGLLIPLVMALNVNTHHLLSIVLALALMCSMAMALPVTTPPNAIAFSSRAIKTKDMMLVGSIMSVVGFVVIVTIGPWYWRFLLNIVM